MSGPTGPIYPESEMIQGDAFFVARKEGPARVIAEGPQPLDRCECSACQIRKLTAQVEALQRERDAARAEHQQWLADAWQRGVWGAGANKETLRG